jgi:hypothetical protein
VSEPAGSVLDGAVDWLAAHLAWFAPERWESQLPRRPFPSGTLLELLVLCRVLRRGRLRDHELIGRAVELAAREVERPEFLAGLTRADQAFPYHAYLVALLADAGRPVPAASGRVATILELGCGDHTGAWRPVQHRLELRYVLDLGGFASTLPTLPALVDQSIVAGAPDPLAIRDDEAYAVTHVVFYGTDFGARRMRATPALADLCRTMLGVYLGLGDLDLAGEFLLSLSALDAPDCALVGAGWRAVTGAQRPDGAVPSALYDASRWQRLAGDRADAYLFGTCHHTTMVAAMAAAERERRCAH